MEDFSAHTLRELLTLARERLGAAAAGLKTREELLAALGKALGNQTPPSGGSKTVVEVVTRDFFRRRNG